MTKSHPALKALAALVLLGALLVLLPGMARAASLPDPMIDGPQAVTTMSVGPTPGAPGDPGEAKLGLVSLQEPQGTGNAPGTGTPPNAANAANLQVRGSLYYPTDTTRPAPLIFLVHGNHGSCHISGPSGSGANCTAFNRNDTGYAYLAHNLASWGYVVFSLDQDQLIYYQDGNYGKGMHQRRLLIAAALDGLYAANQPGGLPMDDNDNVGTQLVGKIDFSRIGLMGHSRGGDAVSSFLSYNRTRPAPGRRYTIRAVLALSPVDYERQAPEGVVYGLEAGVCDGDVSNLQGTRMYSRSLHIDPSDPFPRIQMLLHGANHDAFNTEWEADGDDAGTADPACGPNLTTNPTSIRLSQSATQDSGVNGYTWGSADGGPGGTPVAPNFFSADPSLMGDQEKAGLATMSEFFRRYVGGEAPFDPYMTGEVMHDGTPLLPASACPTSISGMAMPCFDRLSTSYFAAPQEREDVLDPDTDNPLTVSDLGTSLTGSGFADPYANSPGTAPQPPTPNGFDWCNPEPDQFTPTQLGAPSGTLPTANKPCPLPDAHGLGGQANGARENAPVNGSYQPQLTLAWDHPVTTTGKPAVLETRIPAGDGDVTQFKALALSTSVNFFDPRNPDRGTPGLTQPEAASQNFTVTLTDAAGHTATVDVGDKKYGLGLQQSVGNITARMHVILRDNRIPLSDFTAQGLDTKNLRDIKFEFGGAGMPQSGSIQLADVRFQEAVGGTKVYAESSTANGPATDTAAIAADNSVANGQIENTLRSSVATAGPSVVWLDGGPTAKAAAASCTPAATVSSVDVSKGKVVLHGSAKDTGCSPAKGKITQVQVSLAKKSGQACRFVTASGTLGKLVSCDAPLSLVTKQTGAWSVSFAHKLPKGSYALTVRAVDSNGTTSVAGKARAVRVS